MIIRPPKPEQGPPPGLRDREDAEDTASWLLVDAEDAAVRQAQPSRRGAREDKNPTWSMASAGLSAISEEKSENFEPRPAAWERHPSVADRSPTIWLHQEGVSPPRTGQRHDARRGIGRNASSITACREGVAKTCSILAR
jgi:hypothetical protein